ncbi:hypothetical protein KIN20_011122 [Parelaphostrongylus tenuis]|uniref:Uncharacterized protein n=1 Tax=Parelaphostrongylus tenuis TaxID=148309 RepID=A0AAD5MCD7_PARTN|nr:hypothetical protein KIN20_011122 [Parelaphostrongylus tenuis]
MPVFPTFHSNTSVPSRPEFLHYPMGLSRKQKRLLMPYEYKNCSNAANAARRIKPGRPTELAPCFSKTMQNRHSQKDQGRIGQSRDSTATTL